MNSLDADTLSLVLNYLTVRDIFTLSDELRNETFTKKYLNSELITKITCKICKKNYTSFVKGHTFLNYIPDNPGDNNILPPTIPPMCISCIETYYYNWLKNSEIRLIYYDNDYDWLSLDECSEGIIIYELQNFTKYKKSKYCLVCDKEVSLEEKLVGLVDDASLFYKYQETYHVSCYISRFVITECVLDLSLKEIKNISL